MKFNHWIFKLPILKNFDAISLPWNTYFKYPKNEVDPETIKHEEIHIAQRNNIGNTRFYIQYICEFMRNFIKYWNFDEAYRNISFEKEAYKHEDI